MSMSQSSDTNESDGDAQLLQRYFKNSDQKAIEDLFSRHAGMVYRVALTYLGNTADAEDIVQTTFLQIVRNSGKGQEIRNVRGWIMRIVADGCCNKVKEEARRRQRQQMATDGRTTAYQPDDQKTK